MAVLYASSYQTLSDARMKTNVTPLDPARALDTVRALRGVKHDWANPDQGGRTYGLIAQEAQKVLPEIVSETLFDPEDETTAQLGVDYSRIVPILTEAIKHLSDRVEALEGR